MILITTMLFITIIVMIATLIAVQGKSALQNGNLSLQSEEAYLAALLIVIALAAGGLSYTTATEVFAPQVKQHRELMSFINAKSNKYAVKGNALGDEKAPLTVYIYTDYNCPFCGAYDMMIDVEPRSYMINEIKAIAEGAI